MELFVLTLTGISILLLTCNVFGNILVLAVFNGKKRFYSANTFLLSNLATSDLTLSILTFVNIFLLSGDGSRSPALPDFILHGLVSVFTLVALAVERYFAVLKPFVHHTKVRKSLLYKVLFAIWLLAAVLSLPEYLIPDAMVDYTSENITTNETRVPSIWVETAGMTYSFVLFVFGFTIPSVALIFCYTRVIFHVWFKADSNGATNIALLKSKRKLTKLFIIITVVFLITWTPTFVRLVARQFLSGGKHFWKFELSAMFLGLFGSTANPVIYAYRSPRFRQDIIKWFTCCCKRKRRPKVFVLSVARRNHASAHLENRVRTGDEPVLLSMAYVRANQQPNIPVSSLRG